MYPLTPPNTLPILSVERKGKLISHVRTHACTHIHTGHKWEDSVPWTLVSVISGLISRGNSQQNNCGTWTRCSSALNHPGKRVIYELFRVIYAVTQLLNKIVLMNVHCMPLIHILPRFFDDFQAKRVLQMHSLIHHQTENTHSSCCVISHENKTFVSRFNCCFVPLTNFNTAYLDFMKCLQP